MKYSAKTKPGMGDPYWYEWSVGQQYIIDMLNPDNNIKCVELQANVKLGLDDVVVTYEGGEKLFVQVKHTRSNNTLTFGDLVSIDNTSEDGSHRYSLLGELAMCLNGLKKKLFGMESFKHSNIMCGLSKTALLAFGWHIEVGVNGMKLFDERGEQIGWLSIIVEVEVIWEIDIKGISHICKGGLFKKINLINQCEKPVYHILWKE